MSVSYLRYAAMGYFASPFTPLYSRALRRDARTKRQIDGLLALGTPWRGYAASLLAGQIVKG